MKHIALLLPDLEVGGAQRVMLMLASEFVSRGHKVDLLVFRPDGPLRDHIPVSVRLVCVGNNRRLLGNFGLAIHSVVRLASWLRTQRPDVVLSSVTGANLVAIVARRLTSIPNILVIREAVTLQNVVSHWRLRTMRWLYPGADAVVALSSAIAQQVAVMLEVPKRRVYCISNPVDTEFVRQQAAAEVDHPWFADPSVRTLVSVGRLIPQKDYVTLLHAFSIASRGNKMRLIIVGEGPMRATLEHLISQLQLSETCQLVGFDPNPWRWMARADLYVLSSQWEGNPNTLLEALALGVPAIVSAYDESVYAIARQFKFAVVPKGDAEAMAQAIHAHPGRRLHDVDGLTFPDPTTVASEYLAVFEELSQLRPETQPG